MTFIRFQQPDPEFNGVGSAEVIVAVAQIVKIVPRYYQLNAAGDRFPAQVTKFGEEELLKGLQRTYTIWDSLGNTYSSDSASDAGRKFIEQLWMDAT
jgi:hypothetical protein